MEKPLISIILSTYNGSKYITESIKSVLNQSYKKFEFIIINDFSTDNVEKIILDFQKKDNRIIYLKNKKNLNVSASRNE
jgi:glycosyltransferase involved in cell wall biosynthesis